MGNLRFGLFDDRWWQFRETKFGVRGQTLAFSARGDVIDEEFPETIPFRVALGLFRIDVQIGNHGNGPKFFTLDSVIIVVASAHIT